MIIEKISKNARKKFKNYFITNYDIYRLIKFVNKPCDIWSLIQRSGYPIPFVIFVLEELEKRNFIKISKNKIHPLVSQREKVTHANNFRVRTLTPIPIFSQLPLSFRSVQKRVRYIINKVVPGGKMAILGDDDLLSLRVSKTNNFKEILVLEIDKRICDLINNLAKKTKLNINVIQFDIRAPLPTKILNKYDIVFTDIPYSAKAFAVFVSRAIHLLKKGAGFHIFVSSSPLLPSIKTELEIQKVITKMNIYLVEKIHMANHKIPKRLMKKYNSFEKIKEIVTLRTSTLDKWYLENLAREEYLMQFATTEKTTPYIKNTFYYGDMYE